MYDVPASGIRHVLITEDVVDGKCPALYWSRGEGSAFWQAWAFEEEKDAEVRRSRGEKHDDKGSSSVI
jgi:ATP-dependent Clp protease ATP-binding subunit ClpX